MKNHDYKLVVICGLARSGTTYVGRALSKARGIHLIHEPLNRDFGVKGVPRWYPYASGDDREKDADTKKLIRDIIGLRAEWTHSSPPEYPMLTRLSKRVYGGRSGLVWSALRLKKNLGFPLHTLCLKDPFATFALGHMMEAHNIKAICLTKHPCALYLSQTRRGQGELIEDLFAQQGLRDRYAVDISDSTWESAMRHRAKGVALLWKIMARTITYLAENHIDLSIVRHEDLCVDPIKMIRGICDHFGIAFGFSIEKYLVRTSQGDQVYAKSGKLHSFKRNSLALKDAWRGIIDPGEETKIREVVGDDFYSIYEQW
ncbi:MAG: sulfotransferase [Candidatus Aminicenantes bacterium]|nr:MAG: sulfotransferase [Candidatus Aminicenantes bacterium]